MASLEPDGPRICVVLASRGRPAVLARTVRHLNAQTLQPRTVILSCTGPADAAGIDDQPGLIRLFGTTGLAAQRNAALAHVPADTDYLVFFDDDFVAADGWLDAVSRVFQAAPDVGAVTGTLLADGIKGPGLTHENALDILATAPRPDAGAVQESYVPYGCNMAFRCAALGDLRFDERLVLYGWLEDRDFGAALERRGWRIIKVGAALGVHLGSKSGRVSGLRLGYSQMVNPLYLLRKGTMPPRAALSHMAKNFMANLGRAFWPEAYVDRRGRLKGNIIAFGHLAIGLVHPERAAEL